jgi:transposase-like protein
MFPEHIKSLRTLLEAFPTEKSCLDYLEWRRWQGTVTSPFIERGIAWQCKDGKYMCKKTRKYFTVRTGTVFEKTKISIRDWFIAIWHMTSYKKGISSVQLAKELGVTQTTAWYLAHKIRRLFDIEPEEQMEGILEADESFFGGKNKNRHRNKKVPKSTGRSFKDKTPVLGIIQRDGLLRAFVVPSTSAGSIQPIIKRIVKPGSIFITDDWSGYNGLGSLYHHFVVKDSKKRYLNHYNPEIHSNTIEGVWSTMKRGYNGIYNWWSRKHLKYYIDEFVFRYNTRKMKEAERFCLFLNSVFKRITYQHIIETE